MGGSAGNAVRLAMVNRHHQLLIVLVVGEKREGRGTQVSGIIKCVPIKPTAAKLPRATDSFTSDANTIELAPFSPPTLAAHTD